MLQLRLCMKYVRTMFFQYSSPINGYMFYPSTFKITSRLHYATKTELFENPFQTAWIWKHRLCVFVWKKKTVLNIELVENDNFTEITWFSSLSFPQTQIQKNPWLLRFQISVACCARKIFNEFSEYKICFQISPRNMDQKHMTVFRMKLRSRCSQWFVWAGAYPAFCSMKRLSVFPPPPPSLDGMLVRRGVTPQH